MHLLTNLARCLQGFSPPVSHYSYKWTAATAFGFWRCLNESFVWFLLCLLWYTTEAAVRAVFRVSPHMMKACSLELVRVWLKMAELDTIKGINYNQACSAACFIVWKSTDLQTKKPPKKSNGVQEKGEIFDDIFVRSWSNFSCVRLHLGCSNRWKMQSLGKQLIQTWLYMIVLTALNAFQPNKHLVIITKSKLVILHHQLNIRNH